MLMCRNHVKVTAGHSVASLMVSAFLPFIITVVCYWRLFTLVCNPNVTKNEARNSNLMLLYTCSKIISVRQL